MFEKKNEITLRIFMFNSAYFVIVPGLFANKRGKIEQ